jgi:pyruvate,water dikinase
MRGATMNPQQHSSSALVLGLDDPRAVVAGLVGAKASNLATLRQAGFPVPDGLVITTAASSGFGSSLSPDAQRALDVIEAWSEGRSIAVRSSGTSEDSSEASFAGQYETILGVVGRQELEEAVKKCLASLYSTRVASYRTGSGSAEHAMAVLVQPMVEASCAGVAFSANPITGVRGEVVIEAVAGLGTRLVSGELTPEPWVVKGDEPTAVADSGGVITAGMATQIADLARRVEAHFGNPQDIEWAVEGEALHLLQARPITSLPESHVGPIPIDVEVPSGYWEHDASHFPNASYPIDSIVTNLVSEAVATWVAEFGYLFDGIEFRDIGGWTYQRLRPIGGKDGPTLPGWLMWILVRTVPLLRRRVVVAREAVRTDKAGRFIREWYETWLPELSTSIRSLLDVDRRSLRDDELLDHCDEVSGLVRRGIEIHSLVHGAIAPIIYELVTTCNRLLGWDMAETLRMVSGTSFKSTEPARQLHLLADMARERPAVLELGQTAEALIADRLRQVDPRFASAFIHYVDEYGHRALGDTSAEPTLAERPSLILDIIRNQIATGYDPDRVDAINAATREEALAKARAALATDADALGELEHVLDRAREAYPAREDNEFYTLSAPFALFRYVVLELGHRLVARGVIERRDDVLFLHLDEARAAVTESTDLGDLVLQRKGERAWAVANPGPPFYGEESAPPASLAFIPADARLPMESMLWSLESMLAIEASTTAQVDGSSIRGTPASPGTFTGPVRIVMGENEFNKIQAGDVLVCPITSPVWSVLFPTIGALITDTGGVLSHPAIIAREYRIPAVVATGSATALLEDGLIVTVDGSAGTVEVVQ